MSLIIDPLTLYSKIQLNSLYSGNLFYSSKTASEIGKLHLQSIYYDYESSFFRSGQGYRVVPVGKGRKGKPHWRYFRALKCDKAWKRQWDKILAAYDEYKQEQGTYKFWGRTDNDDLAKWLRPQLVNATIRYDPLYNKGIAIDFDDDAARTQFILTWA